MRVQAALGSDIALVFDECTPYHADCEYTARSTERTHRWLDRCLEWHRGRGPSGRPCSGSSRAASTRTCAAKSAQRVSEAAVDGIAIGGTLGRDKEEMAEVLALTAPLLPPEAPKHLLGIGEVDDLLGGIALGLDVFDCVVPTRLARHGVALAPEPEKRWRLDLRKAGWVGNREPLVEGCPCPACQRHDRDYLSYLSRAEELTAVRLLVLHNLTYMHELTKHARAAIEAGRFEDYRAAVLAGASPWDAIRLRSVFFLTRSLNFFDDLVDGVAGDLGHLHPGRLVGGDDHRRRHRAGDQDQGHQGQDEADEAGEAGALLARRLCRRSRRRRDGRERGDAGLRAARLPTRPGGTRSGRCRGRGGGSRRCRRRAPGSASRLPRAGRVTSSPSRPSRRPVASSSALA